MIAATARAGRRCLRLPLLVLHVLGGMAVALLVLPPNLERIPSTRPMTLWSRWLCRLLNVRIHMHGAPHSGAVLLAANHISWLDVFCIAAVCPTHFLAKQDVARWPVFGWFSRRAGTSFIQRGHNNGASTAAEQLTWRLHRGERMLIFPEGTSSVGDTVRRFHARLFQAAIHARCPVQAVAVRYPQGQSINRTVPFVGDDGFIPHLWRLLGEGRITVELYFCEPLWDRSRDVLARQAHAQISAIVQQPLATESASTPGLNRP